MPVFLARADVFAPTTVCINDAFDPVIGRPVRVLTIACTTQNLRRDNGANAFILPIPTANATTLRSIDTRGFCRFVEDLARAARSVPDLPSSYNLDADPLADELRRDFGEDAPTILFSKDADGLEHARIEVPDACRPPSNRTLFDWYGRSFPEHAFALCCFKHRSPTRMPPVMIVYEPSTPDRLFIPGLDARAGQPPDTGADVWTDELLIVGTEDRACRSGGRVEYTNLERCPADVRALLPTFAMGRRVTQTFRNADYHGRTSVFRQGLGHLHRWSPGP